MLLAPDLVGNGIRRMGNKGRPNSAKNNMKGKVGNNSGNGNDHSTVYTSVTIGIYPSYSLSSPMNSCIIYVILFRFLFLLTVNHTLYVYFYEGN